MNHRLLPLLALAIAASGCKHHPTRKTTVPPAPAATASVKATPPSDRIWMNGTDDVAVLMYHDVVPRKQVWFDVTNQEFEEQMAALKEAGANVARLDDVVACFRDGKPLPPKTVVLTFDDNTLGIYENAFPIMRKYGFFSTQFIHTAMVGVKTEKDHCSWEQLKEMEASGLVDVESHTANHPPDIRKLSDDEVRAELIDSKAAIESNLGHPCRYLAYTEGNADERIARMVEEAGYEGAFNEQRAWLASPADRLFMPRFAPFRFNNVLEHWREQDRAAALHPAYRDIKSPTNHVAVNGGRTGLSYQDNAFSTLQLAGGADGSLLPPDAGPPGKERNLLPNLRCRQAVLVGTDYLGVPPETQWGAIGRPFVVAGPNSALFTPYQPWMGAEREALGLLVENADFAVMGSQWLVHEGKPVAANIRSLRRASILAITEDGRPIMAHAGSRATVESVMADLARLKAREAIEL